MNRASHLVLCTLLLAGCNDRSGPDFTPIGDGMKLIGICLVLCAVVGALAELITDDNNRKH